MESRSFTHPKVLWLRRLVSDKRVRRAEGLAVAEGWKVVEAALDTGAKLLSVFIDPDRSMDMDLLGRVDALGVPVVRLQHGVLGRVADSTTPQGVMAVVEVASCPAEEVFGAVGDAPCVLVCVDVRDPGNMGTIVRVVAASGATGLACSAGCADPWSPKAVRASAGSVFSVPLALDVDPLLVIRVARGRSVPCYGTSALHGTAYTDCGLGGSWAIFLGNESTGLSRDLAASLDCMVHIPIASSVESLSVSSAAAILCFEAARQRGLTLRQAAGGRVNTTREGM